MQPTVRIMMATYNGKDYISEQILSIINQTFKNWSLIIQDDGSTDGTWEIISSFSNYDNRIEIRKSPEEKHGAYYNFHSIANQEKIGVKSYDYYMFSDQDDKWDLDKIERMIRIVKEEKRANKPLFCYADMRVIDGDSNVIIPSICDAQGLKYVNCDSLFFSHIIYGCNVIMNREAFLVVPIIDTKQECISILAHDNLYAKFSGIFGEIRFMSETTMGYRRHGGNVTSRQQYGFGVRRIFNRIRKISELAKDHAHTYDQSLIAIEMLIPILSDTRRFKILNIKKAIISGGFFSMKYINENSIDWGNTVRTISHKLILYFKMHKKYLGYYKGV